MKAIKDINKRLNYLEYKADIRYEYALLDIKSARRAVDMATLTARSTLEKSLNAYAKKYAPHTLISPIDRWILKYTKEGEA